ncbi:hypothetical protein EVAR_91380_1 [Eumeta japonica]|uniref:Uncharacterized protein n=1 Tax=Eumeta variegata TaxID=151549 RepID=A0A4C1XDT2_EUMVA|nr:hypothetical protein EVAR_91380_1 [Eumeta japonica]
MFVARCWGDEVNARSKRFLLTPTDTQYGVFLAASVPLEEGSLVNVGWFMEASYYSVSNATYWAPLYDDFTCCARGRPIIVEWERDARHSAGLSLVRTDNATIDESLSQVSARPTEIEKSISFSSERQHSLKNHLPLMENNISQPWYC